MGNGIKRLKEQFFRKFKKECDSFESELRNDTPIDTGEMITSWNTFQVSEQKRVITNIANHAGIIANGRVFIRGRWYGSLKGWGVLGVKGLIKKHMGEKK